LPDVLGLKIIEIINFVFCLKFWLLFHLLRLIQIPL